MGTYDGWLEMNEKIARNNEEEINKFLPQKRQKTDCDYNNKNSYLTEKEAFKNFLKSL